MTDRYRCPLCKEDVEYKIDAKSWFFDCPTCGGYMITTEARLDLPDDRAFEPLRHLLQAVTRENSDAVSRTYDPGKRILIRTDNVRDLIGAHRIPADPIGRMNRLLAYVGRGQDDDASAVVGLDPAHDYPVAACRHGRELMHLTDRLVDLELLERVEEGAYRLTMTGWERLYELDREGPRSDAAFLAMWFDDQLRSAWDEGFEPALTACGYKPTRMDPEEHNDKICDRILANIRTSALLVADVTGNRGGVYFEAGFALGLGLPVVWCCQKAFHKEHEPHFDARQYNYILWEDPADLRDRLVNRIEATVPIRGIGGR